MASIALEEKINKIRQQNEEIRRRYEEVEEDKKNAAKLNALVQMVPSSDWPERKEPPEFSNPPPKTKQKVQKDKYEYTSQNHIGDSRRGDGPPPDPKYNFLADSEREEIDTEHTRENTANRLHSRITRGNFRKRGTGRDNMQKDSRIHKGSHRDDYQPGYEAWRAERNRIDEDRISRQRTAEGNWRREWDNDKMHIVDDVVKASNRSTLGDFAKKDYKDFDRKYHANGGDYQNYSRGSHRPYRGGPKNFYGNFENRSHNTYDQHKHNPSAKVPLSPDERTVVATDRSLKVTVNQPNPSKGQVMSVKVNLPSIAGTGRVGPRQRVRATYSQSDVEVPPETESFTRQKSFDEKSKNNFFNNPKPNLKRSHSQKKKSEAGSKSPYLQRKRDDNSINTSKSHDTELKSAYPQKPNSAFKSPKSTKTVKSPIVAQADTDCKQSIAKEEDQDCNDETENLNVKENESGDPKFEANDNKDQTETYDLNEPEVSDIKIHEKKSENTETAIKELTENVADINLSAQKNDSVAESIVKDSGITNGTPKKESEAPKTAQNETAENITEEQGTKSNGVISDESGIFEGDSDRAVTEVEECNLSLDNNDSNESDALVEEPNKAMENVDEGCDLEESSNHKTSNEIGCPKEDSKETVEIIEKSDMSPNDDIKKQTIVSKEDSTATAGDNAKGSELAPNESNSMTAESQEVHFMLNQVEHNINLSGNGVPTNHTEKLTDSPKETEVRPPSNCDNKDVTAACGQNPEPINENIVRPSEAETYSVIESQEQAESNKNLNNTKETENESLLAKCVENISGSKVDEPIGEDKCVAQQLGEVAELKVRSENTMLTESEINTEKETVNSTI